jgi:hypothetical protein
VMQAFFVAFFEFSPMRARYRKFFARVQLECSQGEARIGGV